MVYKVDKNVPETKKATAFVLNSLNYIFSVLPAYMRFVVAYLGSRPWSKSNILVWLAAELLCTGEFQEAKLLLIVPERKNFSPNNMISELARRLYKSDIFITKYHIRMLHLIGIKAKNTFYA